MINLFTKTAANAADLGKKHTEPKLSKTEQDTREVKRAEKKTVI